MRCTDNRQQLIGRCDTPKDSCQEALKTKRTKNIKNLNSILRKKKSKGTKKKSKSNI